MSHDDRRSFLTAVIGDGRPLLLAMAGGLLFAGGFALFLAATGDFLPHDVHYLGVTAEELCSLADCRIVDFMVHDRAAFGGTLLGIGVLYVWLVAFPLTAGEAWAWWTLRAPTPRLLQVDRARRRGLSTTAGAAR